MPSDINETFHISKINHREELPAPDNSKHGDTQLND